MSTQRLNTVINIGGGVSDRFRGSVQGGAEDIGRLQASMRTLRTRAQEIDAEIARGGFGRPVFNAARAELRQYDDTLADSETQIESLQRQLDRGDLGRRDATRAEASIAEYRQTIMQTEESARDLRQEFQSGDFGAATHSAAARAAERHREEIDRLGGQVRNTSGRFGRFRAVGVGAMGAVGGAALAVTGIVAGIGAVVGSVTDRFESLQELTRRTGIGTLELLRSRRAGAQLGFDPQEIADSIAEAQSELQIRIGEFQTEGTGQLADASARGVDVGQLAGLEGVERYTAAIEQLRRIAATDGPDAAREVSDLLFGGQEAQNAFTIASLQSEEQYQDFLDTLANGRTISDATIGSLGSLNSTFKTTGEDVDNAKATLVGLLEPVLIPLLTTIGDLAKNTTAWIDENRTLATVIGGVVLGGIVAATVGIGVLTALIVAGMIPSLFGMAVAGWAAIAPLLPFIAIGLGVIAVIGAITAGIIWMVRNWDRVTEFFDRHWPRIALAVGIILPPIGLVIAAVGLLRDNWDDITGFFGATWDAITGFFQDGADFVALQVNRVLGFGRQIADLIHRITGGLVDLRDNIPGDITIGQVDPEPARPLAQAPIGQVDPEPARPLAQAPIGQVDPEPARPLAQAPIGQVDPEPARPLAQAPIGQVDPEPARPLAQEEARTEAARRMDAEIAAAMGQRPAGPALDAAPVQASAVPSRRGADTRREGSTIVEGDITTVEGDTIINQDISITQLEGESQEQFDRRLNKVAVAQIDAVAGAR